MSRFIPERKSLHIYIVRDEIDTRDIENHFEKKWIFFAICQSHEMVIAISMIMKIEFIVRFLMEKCSLLS